MPKRKRGDAEPVANSANKGLSRRQRDAEQQVQNGQTLLFRAFKAAKGFERQKLSRRSKDAAAKKDEQSLQRINAEIDALKHLDLARAAASYLHKTLMKIKAVSQITDLPPSLSVPPANPSDPATLNIIARLCNSSPIKTALPPILTAVQGALGVRSSQSIATKAGTRSKKTQSETANAAPISNTATGVLIEDEAAADDAGDDSDDFAEFDSRLALESGDSESYDSDNTEEGAIKINAARRFLSPSDHEPSLEESSEHLSSSETKSTMIKGRRRAATRLPSPSPSASSSEAIEPAPQKKVFSNFVPTLTMGGYISGSDSDIDAENANDPSEQKKNRRGQRARRAIWEKKFGQEAKHVKADAANGARGKGGRDQGWDARRGATDGSGRRGGRDKNGRFSGGRRTVGRNDGQPTGANDIQLGKTKHRDDGGKLHPSWEAAKKRKEAGDKPAAAAFSGKKITFS